MSEPMPAVEWPSTLLDGLVALIIVLLLVLQFGRSASERLTVAVGAIRLRPPTLVPLAEAETATAVGLLGGAIGDYLAHSDEGTTA